MEIVSLEKHFDFSNPRKAKSCPWADVASWVEEYAVIDWIS